MLNRDELAALIPHQGAMCLLERVLEWDAGHIVTATTTHRSAQNPLRSDGRLRALHLCEYAAQAMAVHGGLLARAHGSRAQPGMLVSLREVELLRDFVEDLPDELRVSATRLLAGDDSWQYSFTVHHADELIARGRAAIMARKAQLSEGPPAVPI
jgi:predicted hotdog family 3-hydroxylacyl-ACP dehydratase